MQKYFYSRLILLIPFLLINCLAKGQNIDGFQPGKDLSNSTSDHVIGTEIQFNGYTNYWHDTYSTWNRYGNLFKMAVPNVEKTILQSKVDVAEDMGIPGLIMQEGFINGLLSEPHSVLDQPGMADLENSITKENVLIFIDPNTEVGKKVTAKLSSGNVWPEVLKSHQYGATDLKRADAFYLENGDRKLFIVSSSDGKTREDLKKLIDSTKEIIGKYDLHKGWFGT